MAQSTKRRFRFPKIGRDTLLFIGGMAGIFHETVIQETERSALLVLFATMIGLPAFLRSDEKDAEVAPPAPADRTVDLREAPPT